MKRPNPSPRQNLTRQEMTHSHYNTLASTLRDLESDLRWGLQDSDRLPAAWADIAAEPFCPTKEKLTLRVDADVLAFFRATGQGYLTRMNKVLRAYMLARLAGVVKGAEREPPKPHPAEEYLADGARYLDLYARREASAKAGHEVTAMDMELDLLEIRLRKRGNELEAAFEAIVPGTQA